MSVKRRPPRRPRSTGNRRALSHVGGTASFAGDETLRDLLTSSVHVETDEAQTRLHIHGFHSYPARLHPTTARRLVEGLSSAGDTVLDPFCGSGTVLVEAILAARGAAGVDANPLSVRLSSLKLRPHSTEELHSWVLASETVTAGAEERRKKRAGATRRYGQQDVAEFDMHVLLELDGLSGEIQKIENPAQKEALSLAFSSILTKVSRRQGDSSEQRSERRLPSGFTIRMFARRVQEMARQFREFGDLSPNPRPEAIVAEGDARRLRTIEGESCSLIVTSPPYPAVYDYYHHHAVRLRWLEIDGAKFKRREIGSKRQLRDLRPVTAKEQWIQDFRKFLLAARRVLRPKGNACLVLADSAVKDQALRADAIVEELARAVGFEQRAIVSQSRPLFHHRTVQAYQGRDRQEHVIVLQRA